MSTYSTSIAHKASFASIHGPNLIGLLCVGDKSALVEVVISCNRAAYSLSGRFLLG